MKNTGIRVLSSGPPFQNLSSKLQVNHLRDKFKEGYFSCSTYSNSIPKFGDHSEYLKQTYPKNFIPDHARQDILPVQPTDIKGIDSAAYRHIQRGKLIKKLPRLAGNRFFSLHFFPEQHYISLARKSNIAYTFTNRGGFKLNNSTLQSNLERYRGQYQNLTYFQEDLFPLSIATCRSKYRKLIKRALFNSVKRCIKDHSQYNLVSGVFYFRLSVVPVTEDDKREIQEETNKSLYRLLNDNELRKTTLSISREHNKEFRKGQFLLKDVRRYNTLGAENVPGYYPKLPFLGNKEKLA
ncbi:uncharacterized protein PRCAT00001575001 [Priceomyces carsonii]|uniref:uncharacterized protein n=1 Tax=Priceomyces carsonii TaxID=28549 RepID=UPI002ED9D9D7|nr:unnamed protein product [Priceomyces carsonii]